MLHANYLVQELKPFNTDTIQAVQCNVHFGVPGGQGDCMQIGICRVIIDQASGAGQDRRCRKASASLYLNQDGNFEMFFPAEGIMPCTERAVFKNKWFPVPVAHHLDGAIMERLEANTSPVIPVGKYPVTKVQDGYIISF